jgi:transcriptional antiterminator NusG
MQKYYVLHVVSGQEKKVKLKLDEAIQKQGLSKYISEVHMPTEMVTESKGGKQRTLERPFWRGYLILKMFLDDEVWSKVNEIPGVLRFLGGEKPVPLKDEEAASMLQDIEVGKTGAVQKPKFEVGRKIKIVDGPFTQYEGLVNDINHETSKVKVNVSIFGRATSVELDFNQVEEVQEHSHK